MLRRARLIQIRGVVQGVGFRPFAYRLARRFDLAGWVQNGADGVEIHVEGTADDLRAFEHALVTETPPAAQIAAIGGTDAIADGHHGFAIRDSAAANTPTVRIAPDIATCEACLRELFDPTNRRYRYPYINCTDCGPRYSIVRGLPYDRRLTTMAAWPMCAACQAEYDDPADRRFHAQPIACHVCGPAYVFENAAQRPAVDVRVRAERRGDDAIVAAARALADGAIVALKGIGGYHLACDARNAAAVTRLRERKFRKERPFALMVRDLRTAESIVALDPATRALLTSAARPIVLAPAHAKLTAVAPDNGEFGLMLPYAPLHPLLFASGAPELLVLTSANRSSEPIAYTEADARAMLGGIADAFLIGERPIARRVDDSIAGAWLGVPTILRRSRGFAPHVVARVPAGRPILALGGDLKNAVALVVDGSVIVSQHVGDLAQHSALEACATTARDLCAMYGIDPGACLVVHDAHPQYASTSLAHELGSRTLAIQHHRGHVASVVAEREAWSTDVLGLACDGTGYGDDGSIWGGEAFVGSIRGGFTRIAHLRAAQLPGGDAAAHMPVQAAAGFLLDAPDLPDLEAPPFSFTNHYRLAQRMAERNVRTFTTTSLGRLFDVAAALCGFVRKATFEGQAAMWLEHLARRASASRPPEGYAFPLVACELDYRPLLAAMIAERLAGAGTPRIAHAFHVAIADGLAAIAQLHPAHPVAASGGVFQNRLLCELLRERLGSRLWLGQRVPANDGGLCVGQAVLGAFSPERA